MHIATAAVDVETYDYTFLHSCFFNHIY